MPITRLVPPQDWPTLGWEAIAWTEGYLVHGPGDVQGEPLVWDDEWAQILLDAYRLYPPGHPRAGRRVVSYFGVSLPKGRAKSEFAGAVTCFEFIGPARFDGWDAAGEPVGRPVTYPFIRPLATEKGQTGNTYDNVAAMLEHVLERHRKELRLDDLNVGATRALLGKGGRRGKIVPSTAGAASKDGGKESFSVADEPHLYYLPELRSMHAMVRRNTRKRKKAEPWMLATTTMFQPGQGSVAEDLYEEADRIAAQPERRSWGFAWHHREGFEVTDPDDDAAVLASLNEAYGPACDFINTESILEDEIRAPGASWPESVRYFLNRKHKGEGRAIDPLKWDALGDPRRNDIIDRRVVLWFDGSDKGRGGDHTVLGAWALGDGRPHCVLIDWWEPELIDGEWKIDRRKVRRRVSQVREQLDVVRFVCDPHKWIEQVDLWDEEFGDDAAGEPLVISWDTTWSSKMGPAIDRFREALDEGSFTHDGSDQLRWYALNALLVRALGRGDHHALAKEKEPLKIDGLVGAVIGYDELGQVPTDVALDPVAVWV
jgi:hypothetical protein